MSKSVNQDKKLSIRISQQHYDKLLQIAESEKTNVSQILRSLIKLPKNFIAKQVN